MQVTFKPLGSSSFWDASSRESRSKMGERVWPSSYWAGSGSGLSVFWAVPAAVCSAVPAAVFTCVDPLAHPSTFEANWSPSYS